MRLAPATLAFVALFAPATAASARPPACFPERTVMWAAQLQDEQGRVVGGVRAGQQVFVLDDGIGEDGEQALVEVRSPVQLRGRVQRDRLLVFARRELPIEKDWSWWLAEAPLWLLDGNAVDARVNGAEPHGQPSSMPDVTVACTELRGTPPANLDHDGCHGASHDSTSVRSGRAVRWPEETIVTGPADQKLAVGHRPVGLLRRETDRVLVDVVDFYDWYRVRGWAPAARMEFAPRGLGYGRGHGCCEGMIYLVNGALPRFRPLRVQAPLREKTGGEVVTRLPAGAPVAQLGRFEDQALVVYEGRAKGHRWTTVALLGWIPQSALPDRSGLPASVRGRIVFPAGTPVPAASELVVEIARDDSASLPGRVSADLVFGVPALLLPDSSIRARTRDGRWWGTAPAVTSDIPMKVTMKPARAISGRVLTDDGMALPGAQVRNYREQETRTDADGQFLMLFHEDRAPVISASATGFQTRELRVGPAENVTLKLPRRRLLAGGVGRTRAGVCLETELRGEGKAAVPVASDCSFALDWDANYATSIGGRRDRKMLLYLSPRGGRSTIGGCDPDTRMGTIGPKTTEDNVRCDVAGDVVDICLSGPCSGSNHGSLFVRVASTPTQLASGAQVRVRAGQHELGMCNAASGACFVHHLPLGQTVSVEAHAPGSKGTARATVQPRVGVTELTLRLP